MKKYIFFSLLILSACENNTWIEVDLGNDYRYHQGGYYKSIYPIHSMIETAIHNEVTDYNFNNRYIIVKQNPDFEHYRICVEGEYSRRYYCYNYFLDDSTSKTFNEIYTPTQKQTIKADSLLYKLFKSKHVSKELTLEDDDKIQDIVDSVLLADPYYIRLFSTRNNYWIIDKLNNIRLGPFTKKEFNEKIIEMKINLKFKE